MNRFGLLGVWAFTLCGWLAGSAVWGQEGIIIPISNGGTVEVDCDSSELIYFTDDNSGSTDFQDPYSNTNYTITLCPSTPGDAVQVNFLAFDLQTNANPNNNDVLIAYNGDNTGADMVGIGAGNSFTGVSITASIDNPTGCVTFQLIVNNNATGGDVGWVADVSCVTPCSYPEAGITLVSPASFPDNPVSVGVCPDELVTFDASGSLPGAPEFPVDSLIWNWGDGSVEVTAVSDGWQQSHSYPEPGEYIVTLVVQDINACNSTNLLPHQVLVSTIPIFNTDFSSPLCEDAPGFLNGDPVQSITWTALPPVGVSELADLPDATGVAFTSELFIDFFDTDQVLEDCDDIELITANIEHSFIGDLSFWITCPDGTEVILMENGPSGGPDPNGCTPNDLGGNNLGIVDVEGYDYSWNMDAEWVLDDANNPNADNPMPEGTYLPCGDLCDFVGCPLNGIWTFNVIDQWAADNGTLFGWSIDFNPNIVPGITTFTPVIGMGSDSSYWHPVGDLNTVLSPADLGVVAVSDDANYVDLMFPDPGTFEFGYLVTNNFGCSWDTTVTIEVIENPGTFITAGPDQIFCANPVQLLGSLDTGGGSACGSDAGQETYCYGAFDNTIFSYCPDNPGDGTMMTISFSAGMMEAGWDFVTVYDGPDATGPAIANLDANFAGQSFTATNPDGCISFQFSSDGGCDCAGFCNFEPIEWCVSCAGSPNACGYDWMWEPADYLDDPTSPQPWVTDFDGAPIEYTLYVEPVGFDNCQATATVTVGPGFEYEIQSAQPSCFANDGIISVDVFEDANDAEGPFTIQLYQELAGGPVLIDELVWDNLTDFYHGDLVPAEYTVVVFNNEGCIYNTTIVMEDPLPLSLNVPNVQTICQGGTANLQVSSDQDPLNVWTYVWDNGLPEGPVQQVSPGTSTVYTVTGYDINGCPTPDYQIGVNVLPGLNADLVASDFLCSGEEAYLDASASFGGSGTGYNYTWTFEGAVLNEDEESIWTVPPSSGEFCVTLTDDCETPASTACADVVLETPVPIAFSADTTSACGTGTFLFTNETNPGLISSNLWEFGDDTYSGESNTVKTFQSPGFYDVTLHVTSLAGGCEYSLTQEAYIHVYPIPNVGFYAGPQPTRVPDTEIQFTGYSDASVVSWLWTFNVFNPIGFSAEQNPTFQFPQDVGGQYPVQLTITDAQGCTNTVTEVVEIKDIFNLFIPTAFTPNNDGTNDAFFIQGTDIDPDRFEFEIYNRWGEIIWSTTDPTDAWYGQVGDEGQHYVPNGPYPYRVEVHSLEEESYRKEVFGTVMIIR
jgi:gliding motility-associated-like protein